MQKYVIALYIRLSIEDYKYDSLSIENQLLVLNEYAAAIVKVHKGAYEEPLYIDVRTRMPKNETPCEKIFSF